MGASDVKCHGKNKVENGSNHIQSSCARQNSSILTNWRLDCRREALMATAAAWPPRVQRYGQCGTRRTDGRISMGTRTNRSDDRNDNWTMTLAVRANQLADGGAM